MSGIMKVFVLLAVMVCISEAQMGHTSGKQCLCQKMRDRITSKNDIKDIQVYSATIFCDKVEIVVSLNSGRRYCLNPKLEAVQKLMASIMKQGTSSTARPTKLTSTTNTARV
ncbi:platelet basic protein-like [Anarrhichthys ocellatus]|uniref:platelet basic protein-like n=1 Tax=Anarrhichthys ocellatus TaxID=433405 RepID=UPI0012EE680B|nr:platelet basic protein-like [Anarrhichthys ocellatus]